MSISADEFLLNHILECLLESLRDAAKQVYGPGIKKIWNNGDYKNRNSYIKENVKLLKTVYKRQIKEIKKCQNQNSA